MPHSEKMTTKGGRHSKPGRRNASGIESRYTVALAPALALQVEQYAKAVDTSMSKAMAALVRLGLENQQNRKQEFFKRLKENLANNDPRQEDRLVDEFRALILGH